MPHVAGRTTNNFDNQEPRDNICEGEQNFDNQQSQNVNEGERKQTIPIPIYVCHFVAIERNRQHALNCRDSYSVFDILSDSIKTRQQQTLPSGTTHAQYFKT
jgi:hypothetical protein